MPKITLHSFNNWLNKLSKHDVENFKTLIGLPNALEVVGKLPEGEYKNMAVFRMAVIEAAERNDANAK